MLNVGCDFGKASSQITFCEHSCWKKEAVIAFVILNCNRFDWLMRVHCDTSTCHLWQSLALSVFLPGFNLCFLAKNINKTIEHLKYKMYQNAGRNRPKEQSNIIYSSTCKNSIKINRLGIRRICLCLEKKKACKIVVKNMKKIQEYQKH